jgi:leucyl aminopeptidase
VLPGVATDSFTRIADPRDASRAIVVIGLGSGVTTESLRLAGGAAVRKLSGSTHVDFALGLDDVELVTAVAEGALLGAYALLDEHITAMNVGFAVCVLAVVVLGKRTRAK